MIYCVDLIPVKRRPRFSRGRAYVDARTKSDERAVRKSYTGEKFAGAVAVTIRIFAPLPKSRPKRIIREPFTVKPDADNIAKAVLDGLNGVAWFDDAQVTTLIVEKMPRERGERARLVYTVQPDETKEGIE